MDVMLLLLGLGVLILGGEFLVKGSVLFAKVMKLSPLVVGMTIVAFGTSAPELIVSLTSALKGDAGIAVGNIVGSNIANITLILGITVLIFPIVAERQTKVLDLPFMLLVTGALFYVLYDGVISMVEGIVMVLMIIIFTAYLINYAKRKSQKEGNEDWEDERKKPSYWRALFFLQLGFVGLYFGADWFVEGAVGIADWLMADNPDKETIIGATVVAFGTSAPELVASTVAAYRKQTDISVGNLVGSNIFNVLVVLGITSIVKPIPVESEVLEFDIWWVIGSAVLLALTVYIGKRIGWLKGLILTGTYLAYILLIVLKVKGEL